MTNQTIDIHAVIETLSKSFESVFKRSDAAEIASFYTDNGILLPTGYDFIKGKQDIEVFWQGAIDMGIKNAKLDIVEIEQHGDTAIELSKYTLSDVNGQEIDHGKGIVIWKSKNDSWKIHRDIWNSSVAA